jgi:hypothetical protein
MTFREYMEWNKEGYSIALYCEGRLWTRYLSLNDLTGSILDIEVGNRPCVAFEYNGIKYRALLHTTGDIPLEI